jgi:UPF0271 protein
VRIDVSGDVGEGSPDDEDLIPLLTSVNVACGAHAGSAATIARTVELARLAAAAVGAHPGYPDRAGFGRRDLDLAALALESTIVEQVQLVADAASRAGTGLRHVKPHGALYNRSARDPLTAAIVARAVRRVSPELVLVGLAGSASLAAARAAGLATAAEAFADRTYEPDGRLRDRREPDALVDDPVRAGEQAVSLARDHRVVAVDGSTVPIAADTLCIHGDRPGAVGRARAVRTALAAAGVEVRPLRQ